MSFSLGHQALFMATQPFKRTTKLFPYRDEACFIQFTGNGDDITPAEMQAWAEKYRKEAMALPIGHPLIVDYDLERASSRSDNHRP